jgi:hypothetical protein
VKKRRKNVHQNANHPRYSRSPWPERLNAGPLLAKGTLFQTSCVTLRTDTSFEN